MSATKYLAAVTLSASIVLLGPAWAGDHPEHPKADQSKEHPKSAPHETTQSSDANTKADHGNSGQASDSHDIIAVAGSAENIHTLVTAIQAAGLAHALHGEGPFTVFAPSDAAFQHLPEGALEELMKPENREMLVNVLQYHVVPGRIMAASLSSRKIKAVNGQELRIEVSEAGPTVDGAQIVRADMEASNGIIHVIDTVLRPVAPKADPETSAPKDHPGH